MYYRLYHYQRKEMAGSLEFILTADPQLINDADKSNVNKVAEEIAASLPEDSPPIEMKNIAIAAFKPEETIDLLRPAGTESIQASFNF